MAGGGGGWPGCAGGSRGGFQRDLNALRLDSLGELFRPLHYCILMMGP